MPKESFKAKLEKSRRIRIPALIRWKYKIKPGMVLHIEVSPAEHPLNYERFFARLRKDGRFTVPKVYAETLELKPGVIVAVRVNIPDEGEEIVLEPLKPIQVETLKVPGK